MAQIGAQIVEQVEWHGLYLQASSIFTPSAPVSRRSFFAGRIKEVGRVIDSIQQVGQHVIVYGERGVGKTSMANVLKEFLETPWLPAGSGEASNEEADRDEEPEEDEYQEDDGDHPGFRGVIVLKATCTSESTYDSLWRDALDASAIRVERRAGFRRTGQDYIVPVKLLEESQRLTPSTVRRILTSIGQRFTTLVIFDEFDRIGQATVRQEFADTIKTLSDHQTPATIVLVGVAADVAQLISEHQSIERALKQVKMPLMGEKELSQIVVKGLTELNMTITNGALSLIVRLSQGLPHYTHSLALHSVRAATLKRTRRIDQGIVVNFAIPGALADTDASVLKAYQDAVATSKRTSNYPKLLLACALTERDDFGNFAAKDIEAPLSQLLGKPSRIPNFATQLANLCNDDRGPALMKIGKKQRFRYRFANPLLQPFVIARGLADALITPVALIKDLLKKLQADDDKVSSGDKA